MSATAPRPESSASPGVLPRLAVVYEPNAVQLFELAEAARQTWETVWLIDRSVGGLGETSRLLARFGQVVDITDLSPAQVKEALRARSIDGIVSFGESLLMRAALIADELDLPFYSPEAAERLTDKNAQRHALRAAGVPTPRSALLRAGADADACRAIMADVTFPVVVKPVSGNSSQGVFAVEDADHLAALVEQSGEGLGRRDMVVEERIPDGWPADERPYADYVSVESFLSHGRASHFVVTGRMPQAERFRETGTFQPSNISSEDWRAVTDMAEQGIAALGATIGVFHTEIKLAPAGCRIVEINGRLGGGSIARIGSEVTGRSLINAAGRIALGQDVDVSDSVFSGVGFYYQIQPPIGARTLLSLEGLDAVRAFPGVFEVAANRHPGDQLDPVAEGTVGFIYSVYGKVDTHEDLWKTLARVRDAVQVSFGT